MNKLFKLYYWAKSVTFEFDEVFFFIITLLFLLCVIGCIDINQLYNPKAKYSFTLSSTTVINAECDVRKPVSTDQNSYYNCKTDEFPPNNFNIYNAINVLEFQ